MSVTLHAFEAKGSLCIPCSKSVLHRALLLSACAQNKSTLLADALNDDTAATIHCLNALGACITRTGEELKVVPVWQNRRLALQNRAPVDLFVNESGSTLRFLVSYVGALGIPARFHMQGRLAKRPLEELTRALTLHGMTFSSFGDTLTAKGTLTPGTYTLPGNVSSQYITSLLLALPLLGHDSILNITSPLESRPYIDLTLRLLDTCKIHIRTQENTFFIPGAQRPQAPACYPVEGDYSSAAAFIALGALSTKGVTLKGLNSHSVQGDKKMLDIVQDFGALVTTNQDGTIHIQKQKQLTGTTIDASDIPDLVPVLSALALGAQGPTTITGAGRLRLKESDRLQTTHDALSALGAHIEQKEDGLIIHPTPSLTGGTVSAFGDHRIAMCIAVAASLCPRAVTIEGSECVSKSYPGFFNDLASLIPPAATHSRTPISPPPLPTKGGLS